MKETKQNENTSISMGQQRRLERKKEIKKMKRNARLSKVISYSLIALIAVGLISTIGYTIYRGVTKIKPSSEYSAYLTDDGLIKGVTATEYLDLVDYTTIKAPLSEIEYSDEKVDADIKTLLEGDSQLSTETDALIKDGDIVNIDYVGSVDGVEFAGGNSNGEGQDLEIGSSKFVDDFEEQLIGHGIGENVTVEVTFPTDYTNNTDLAGKDAVFEVVINGIYELPEFTDEYVKENLSENASTVVEYREYLKKTKYEENLTTWLKKYLMDNTTVKSYPSNYINHLKTIKKFEDQSSLAYMNSFYASMGYPSNATFEDYVGMSEAKYDASLGEMVQDRAKEALLYQAIYEKEDLSVTTDDYSTYFDEKSTSGYDAHVEQQGVGYVMQQIINKKALEYVKGLVTVE